MIWEWIISIQRGFPKDHLGADHHEPADESGGISYFGRKEKKCNGDSYGIVTKKGSNL